MSIANLQRQTIGKLFLLVFVCFLANCAEKPIEQVEKPVKQTVIMVKVPPFYNDKLSDAENLRRFDSFLFSPNKISNSPPKDIPKGIPNYDAILTVSLNANGSIELNSTEQGNVSGSKQLQATLEKIFNDRKEAGVYEARTWKVVKAVGIEAENSVKYGDLFKIVEAVKKSGADPIVLRFEDDAGNFKNYFKK